MDYAIIVYTVCLVIACLSAYRIGYVEGNQQGFKQCSEIWARPEDWRNRSGKEENASERRICDSREAGK